MSHACSTVVCIAPERARVPRVDERTLSVCLYIHTRTRRTYEYQGIDTAQPRMYACTDQRDCGTVRIRTGRYSCQSAPLLSLLCAVSFHFYADGFSSVKEKKI
jgi:hypothetical protein